MFHAILVDELDVVDISSTFFKKDLYADLPDRLFSHVDGNEIIAFVTSIVELSLNALFEDKLNATERSSSFASFDLLELQRPCLILTV